MFSPEITKAICDHAISEYPNESVGIVTDAGYIPMKNVHRDPIHNFDCTKEVMPYLIRKEVKALVHSHPDGPEGPTEHDMIQQIATGLVWGIVACNGAASLPPYYWSDTLPVPPLVNRQFRHGPSGTDGKGDCYALVRDFYRLRMNVDLPEYPRSDDWWIHGKSLYEDGFEKAGFVEVDKRTPKYGDLILMRYPGGVKTANHGAIYVGNGEILHHISNRLSRIDQMVKYQRFVVRWLRYEKTE